MWPTTNRRGTVQPAPGAELQSRPPPFARPKRWIFGVRSAGSAALCPPPKKRRSGAAKTPVGRFTALRAYGAPRRFCGCVPCRELRYDAAPVTFRVGPACPDSSDSAHGLCCSHQVGDEWGPRAQPRQNGAIRWGGWRPRVDPWLPCSGLAVRWAGARSYRSRSNVGPVGVTRRRRHVRAPYHAKAWARLSAGLRRTFRNPGEALVFARRRHGNDGSWRLDGLDSCFQLRFWSLRKPCPPPSSRNR